MAMTPRPPHAPDRRTLKVHAVESGGAAGPVRAEERVAKLMANRGLCSRREAERLIEQGAVMVNGVVVREQGCKAPPDVDIRIASGGLAELAAQVTILLHKPIGVVSTQPEAGQTPAWKLVTRARVHGAGEPSALARAIAAPSSLAVAGRLDRASRGLLVLTQDGSVARRIIGGHGVEKCYVVRTAEPATDVQMRKLRGRLSLDAQPLLPMSVERVADDTLRFVLVEGKKHQIRRLCRRFGLTVVDLFRVAIGPLAIGDLPEGCWRVVRPEELERLRADGRVSSQQRKAESGRAESRMRNRKN
jgi:23S rRNA pseudouridine2604 synthase